ncbi:M14 family metallopeptidase [Nocardioides salsibiostraticola]
MLRLRSRIGMTGLALVASALVAPSAAVADPDDPRPRVSPTAPGVSEGRGADTTAVAPSIEEAEVIRQAAAAPSVTDPLVMPTSYPSQPSLRFYRDNPDDAATAAGLLSHPDLAPRLTEWMEQSDRISTQIVGQTELGRDLYLVTVTAPERAEDTAQQKVWRDTIKNDPEAAAADAALLSQYKTPVWFSGNIHGNEWEGTDGIMAYIDYLVNSPLSEVGGILRNNRLYFSLSLNPDGRTAATRTPGAGLDINRDMITNVLNESISFVRTAQAVQPIYSADLHGYTRVLQIEPTGPPHGSNYEYDVYLPHNYDMALQVEQEVVDAEIPGNTYYDVTTGSVVDDNTGPDTAHVKIPYRDTPSGWDDFPPIFTAQYAAFYGAATSTVELPLRRGAPGGRQTPENGVVNTAVALQTITSMVDYMNDSSNARAMLADQIEVFRRAVAGEAKTSLTLDNIADVPGPDQWKSLWDVADDQEPVSLPRAYVIPTGDDQRSSSDANGLVESLLFHDIEVGTLDAPAAVGGTTYPAGSYVVDMHQPLRGLANSLLDLGDDISDKVPSMYDISAWSYSFLWGATVDKVGSVTDDSLGATTPVTTPTELASVAEGAYLTLDLTGTAEVRAVNALLDDGVDASLLPDGSVVVGPEGRTSAQAAADEFDVAFEAATAADLAALSDEATRGLGEVDMAYVGSQEDFLSLNELGFDNPVRITSGTLNADPSLLDGVEILWITSTFDLEEGSAGRTAVQAFVDAGGAIVGRTNRGFEAASSYGLVSGTPVTGNSSGNGIVDVDTAPDSFLKPYEQDSAFFYPAYWFTDLGDETTVEQSYAADPLLAGHWRPRVSGGVTTPTGPDDAANQAAVVSGEAASGARAVIFGTSVFFRTHPKGGMSQAGRAIFWAAPEGDGVTAPEEPTATTVSLSGPGSIRYPQDASYDVSVASSGEETPAGSVELLVDDAVVAESDVVDGAATLVAAGQTPGSYQVTARFTPDSAPSEPTTSAPVELSVAKAKAFTRLIARQTAGPGKVKATVKLRIPGLQPRATVVLRDRGSKVRTFKVRGSSGQRTITVRLGKGRHTLRAVVPGTPLVATSRSNKVKLVIR